MVKYMRQKAPTLAKGLTLEYLASLSKDVILERIGIAFKGMANKYRAYHKAKDGAPIPYDLV